MGEISKRFRVLIAAFITFVIILCHAYISERTSSGRFLSHAPDISSSPVNTSSAAPTIKTTPAATAPTAASVIDEVTPTAASTPTAPPHASAAPTPKAEAASKPTASSTPTAPGKTEKPSQVPPAPDVEVKEEVKPEMPDDFVYLAEFIPEARFEIRYATTHNFTGQVVDGYLSDKVSATKACAVALKKAAESLKESGYGIVIYDAYRPKRAVEFFIEWSKKPEDNLTKAEFYPDFTKSELFTKGYLAKRSAHSRGSTIDLTLFDLATGIPLDMGSPYDFLGPISNHGTRLIDEAQTRNRNILKDAMTAAGFKAISTEWWHYQLIDEPYPQTYFDFIIQ